MINFAKPQGFASLTSSRPKLDSVPLGNTLRTVADGRATADTTTVDDTLEHYLEEHTRYADATRIASLSSPHAIKSWAAERLPTLNLSYGYTNQIDATEIQSNLDPLAPLRLVEFADDITLIADYSRDILDLKIEATPHKQGLVFRFVFHGLHRDSQRAEVEHASIEALLQERSSDNCLRKRIVAVDHRIEAECIVLRKRMRLGFSKLF